ncbi:MAG: substrate-binding domain-containing protein [Terriglobia bacterium]
MQPRRIVILVLGISLTAVLLSCQKSFHEETERYYFISANIALPYWQEAQAGFQDAGRALGVKVEFKGPESYNPEDEVEAFRKAVQARPAGIAVSPTRPDLFVKEIDSAIEAGIPVLCVDSDAPESKRVLFVGTDNFLAGQESGRRIAELLHGKGRIALITITGQYNLEERRRGVDEVLKKYPDLKISQELNDKGDPRIANDQISALLESKDKKDQFDGILCLEASGGPGAAEALHRLNLDGKYPIVAMDKNPETLDWISRGAIAATVAQKSYTMAYYSLKMLDDLHHNVVHEFTKDWRSAPTSPLPKRVDTGTAVIDKTNLADFQAAIATRAKPM